MQVTPAPTNIPARPFVPAASSGTASMAASSSKSFLINGRFDFWQRGTSFNSNNVYTADRWRLLLGTGNTATLSRQTLTPGDIEGSPRYFMRVARTVTGSGDTTWEQPIEGVGTLSAQSMTISFWAKASSAGRQLTASAYQSFGTGGTPSANNPIAGSNVTLTTSWARYSVTLAIPSIAGKTLGTGLNDALVVVLGVASAEGNFTVDVAQVQVDEGTEALDFTPPDIASELLRCQRYYEVVGGGSTGLWASASTMFLIVVFRVTKRAVVTSSVATQTWSGARLNISNVSGTSFAIAVDSGNGINNRSYMVTTNNVGAAAGNVAALYTDNIAVEAEL